VLKRELLSGFLPKIGTLLDITQQIEGGAARFLMADSASPTIVREVGDTSALYVLMPMRV